MNCPTLAENLSAVEDRTAKRPFCDQKLNDVSEKFVPMPSERKGDCSCAPCAEKQDVKNRSAFKTYRNHKAMKSW